MINLQKNETELAQSVLSKINLSKDGKKLEKHVVNLSKCVVDLSKKSNVDIGATKAQVVVVMDYSGSMSRMYSDGTVQNVITKLLPLGLTFDDNGEVEVFRFSNDFEQFDSLNVTNYEHYVDEYIYRDRGRNMGGTYYAPVLKEIKKQYIGGNTKTKGFFGLFKKDKKTSTLTGADANVNPVFVIFITDGDNSDKSETDEIIRELSKENCFVQFIGVGSASMSYLEKLDDLNDRDCDNTGFEKFKDIESVDDIELYNKILCQYADWLKVKGF